ncbi:unnamed protein product, partial [Brassica rapa]
MHANWRNDKLHNGGAWITQNHRDRLTAELRCLIWVMKSLRDLHIHDAVIASDSQDMRDLHIHDAVIASDSQDMVDATNNPTNWTRYSREVVKSVRDSGYQCYFIFRGM